MFVEILSFVGMRARDAGHRCRGCGVATGTSSAPAYSSTPMTSDSRSANSDIAIIKLHKSINNVLHGEGSDDWILQIKYVQKRDNGTYECQKVASGGGGTLSRRVELRVLVPEAFILGAEEYHVDAGSAINLVCIIENVSWVRRRDWHILSSGLLLYTNDERFQVLHGEGSDDWILQIKYVQKRDNGTYECQKVASGGGGTLSRRVELRVLVPEAFILGAEEYHVDAGSAINLVCIIENSPAPPQYVFWYHNARMINYDEAQGVTVSTAPGARTQSALRVHAARPSHAGNYSCRAPGADPAHIYVYVSEGSDKMAATLSRNAAVAQGPPVSVLLYALLASAVLSAGALERT
ncbi:Hemicentin-2 [Papilio machaon]|uniref:Hemicentin-2 n=1 Tax=Papilio machaon TaxID=76193 RepID=A0A194R3F3_PAPMA|nr:Hemicentin-2 [Papilio machaon]